MASVQVLCLCLAAMLAGCVDSSLTMSEQHTLFEMRQIYRSKVADDSLYSQMILSDPEDVAHDALDKHDYRLISVAMGYGAQQNDAALMGIACQTPPPAVEPFVFGCVPPPSVLFKQILRYNHAMVASPLFPKEYQCAVDQVFVDEMEAFYKKEEDDRKRREISRIEKERKAESAKQFNE